MSPTRELSLELAARMLLLSDSVADVSEARRKVEEKLADGSALERFRQNIELQGGDPTVCDDPEKLFESGLIEVAIESETTGIVSEIDTFKLGNSLVDIGGGRTKAEDKVDPAVGFRGHVGIGAAIKQGEALGLVYCRNSGQADLVRKELGSAFKISDNVPVVRPKLIQAVIGE